MVLIGGEATVETPEEVERVEYWANLAMRANTLLARTTMAVPNLSSDCRRPIAVNRLWPNDCRHTIADKRVLQHD